MGSGKIYGRTRRELLEKGLVSDEIPREASFGIEGRRGALVQCDSKAERDLN